MGATWEPEILNEGYQSKLTFPPIKSSNVKAEILLIKTWSCPFITTTAATT